VIDFKGSHFEREIVLWGVRWYVAYPIRFVARILRRRQRASWWSRQPVRMVAGIPKLVIRFSALHPIFASTC
jgi:hypothetical protein